jgi:hypothetical protein
MMNTDKVEQTAREVAERWFDGYAMPLGVQKTRRVCYGRTEVEHLERTISRRIYSTVFALYCKARP